MPFFYIKNACEQNVYLLDEPWRFDTSKFPYDLTPQKYKAWWKQRDTKGCLLSLCATDYHTGAYGTRVDSKDNPPKVIYGLAADYDGSVLWESGINAVLSKTRMGKPFMPQWAVVSQSGKMHLYWLFEQPVRCLSLAHAKAFLAHALKAVKAKDFGATSSDYDATASESPTQYFDIGRKWIPVAPADRIPIGNTIHWAVVTAEETVVSRLRRDNGTHELPFDVVNSLIAEHYPHANIGEVKLGTRCRRFWDDSADNPNAAVAVSDGFVVFTPHDHGFKSWDDLFGRHVVEAAIGATRDRMLDDFVVVPRRTNAVYYRKVMDATGERYSPVEMSTLKLLLRSAGYNPKARKGEALSELERAILYINEARAAVAAAPYLYYPQGLMNDRTVDERGSVLNTSTIRTVRPNNTPGLFKDGAFFENPECYNRFPFLYQLLVSLFCTSRSDYVSWRESGKTYNGSANAQLNIFISWLAHFYVNAYRNTPSHGQALYLVGPSGCGKTFISSHIIPALMGGRAASGEQFFLSGGTFTKEIAESPVIVLDDVIPTSEYVARVSATQRIKSFVASGTLKYEAKGVDATTIPFRGRLICTSNSTERDLSVLPTIDSTTSDKFTILSVGKGLFRPDELTFLSGQSMERTMQIMLAELPYFARFLLEWKVPEGMQDSRWGVVGYQDQDIVRTTVASSPTTSIVLEVLSNMIVHKLLPTEVKDGKPGSRLDTFSADDRAQLAQLVRKRIAKGGNYTIAYRGTPLRLYTQMRQYDAIAMNRMTPAAVSFALTSLSASKDYERFFRTRSKSSRVTWLVDYRFLFVYNGEHFEDLAYAPPVEP